MSLPANTKSSNRGRYLLVGSLTLNLALAAAVGAVALQHSNAAPLQPVAGIKRGVEQRFDRIAASMSADDARIMRTEFRLQAVKIAAAEAELRLSEEAVRNSLRAQPFDPAAERAAMADANTARERFYQLVHDALADATTKMSPAGRETLADWRTRSANTVIAQ